jgi:16S rRNA (guanine527-N7)-methyltransferase
MASSVDQFSSLLSPIMETLQLTLDAGQFGRLHRHFELLLRWNDRVSLTSIRDPGEIARRHFGESLFVASVLPLNGASLVDIGAGAGFPGLPIAVARPEVKVTLVESVGKKVTFLKEAARGIPNVEVWQGRFEDLKRHFDWATFRAVALEGILPFVFQRATYLAILTTAVKVPEISRIPGVCWDAPKYVPWDRRTVLMTGNVVSRET